MKEIIEILSDKPSLVKRGSEIIVEKIKSTLNSQEQFTIALAGGSTPKPLYELLADCDLPWEKIHFFWGDERYVPANDPQSNQLMARESWLDKIEIPPSNIHPMSTNSNNPQKDAEIHEKELRDFFGVKYPQFPVFDLILLGIGDDAHTASLFPHTAVLNECQKAIACGKKNSEPRITFTIPLINNARCVLFLIAGANKRFALSKIFATNEDNMSYPARFIKPQEELWWLLDKMAGEEIEQKNN